MATQPKPDKPKSIVTALVRQLQKFESKTAQPASTVYLTPKDFAEVVHELGLGDGERLTLHGVNVRKSRRPKYDRVRDYLTKANIRVETRTRPGGAVEAIVHALGGYVSIAVPTRFSMGRGAQTQEPLMSTSQLLDEAAAHFSHKVSDKDLTRAELELRSRPLAPSADWETTQRIWHDEFYEAAGISGLMYGTAPRTRPPLGSRPEWLYNTTINRDRIAPSPSAQETLEMLRQAERVLSEADAQLTPRYRDVQNRRRIEELMTYRPGMWQTVSITESAAARQATSADTQALPPLTSRSPSAAPSTPTTTRNP